MPNKSEVPFPFEETLEKFRLKRGTSFFTDGFVELAFDEACKKNVDSLARWLTRKIEIDLLGELRTMAEVDIDLKGLRPVSEKDQMLVYQKLALEIGNLLRVYIEYLRSLYSENGKVENIARPMMAANGLLFEMIIIDGLFDQVKSKLS